MTDTKTFTVRVHDDSKPPLVFRARRDDPPAERPVSCCDYDTERNVFSVPPRIQTSSGEWIDNPMLPVLQQWQALRQEAMDEL